MKIKIVVPLPKYEKFKSILKHMEKRNERFNIQPFEIQESDLIIDKEYKTYQRFWADGRWQVLTTSKKIPSKTVEVEMGSPVYSDWRIMFVFDNIANEKNIKSFFLDPKKCEEIIGNHIHGDLIRCDHCNSNRYRRYAFFVESKKTKEIKCVGSDCLKDFLGESQEKILKSFDVSIKTVGEIKKITDDLEIFREKYDFDIREINKKSDDTIDFIKFVASIFDVLKRNSKYDNNIEILKGIGIDNIEKGNLSKDAVNFAKELREIMPKLKINNSAQINLTALLGSRLDDEFPKKYLNDVVLAIFAFAKMTSNPIVGNKNNKEGERIKDVVKCIKSEERDEYVKIKGNFLRKKMYNYIMESQDGTLYNYNTTSRQPIKNEDIINASFSIKNFEVSDFGVATYEIQRMKIHEMKESSSPLVKDDDNDGIAPSEVDGPTP